LECLLFAQAHEKETNETGSKLSMQQRTGRTSMVRTCLQQGRHIRLLVLIFPLLGIVLTFCQNLFYVHRHATQPHTSEQHAHAREHTDEMVIPGVSASSEWEKTKRLAQNWAGVYAAQSVMQADCAHDSEEDRGNRLDCSAAEMHMRLYQQLTRVGMHHTGTAKDRSCSSQTGTILCSQA
jgi:hypothetical protein